VGKYLGSFSDVPAEGLAEKAIRAVVDRSGVDPASIHDVIFAQSYANGEASSIGRWAALAADLSLEVPGMQLDHRCAGGLTALATAAAMVQAGHAEVILAGAAESMSNVEYYTNGMRKGMRAGYAMLYDRLERQRERSQPEERFGKDLRNDRDRRERRARP
jgi:acetyl-CoA C-acetyltransferase